MPGLNLTKTEAAERAAVLAVDHYDVVLDLSEVRSSATFGSRTTVTFSSQPGASTWIDLVAAEVREVTLNGVALDPASYRDSRIPLGSLAEHNTLVVDARCKYTRDGTGLHRFVDPVDGETYLYTQFECPDARQMYASFEQPDLKAEFTFTVTGPEHWEVVSNSLIASRDAAGAGLHRWRVERTKRMSTYVTAIVAGPYHHVHDEYSGSYGTYPLGIYCRKSLAPFLDHERLFTETKQGFAFFEEQFRFGYPFGKYDQLFCPEYNASAMENAGCVTIYEDFIFRSKVTRLQYIQRANTVLHELAHMWFGDLVTMRWWEDLWLNESFAEWASYWAMAQCTEYSDAWAEFLALRKEWGYREDQLPSTHPIAAQMPDLDSVRPNFDGISYAKGASVLKQLVAYAGEDAFITGVRAYLQKHQYANASLADLLTELSSASGRDLAAWTNSWIQTPGVNLLRLEVEVDSDGLYTKAVVHQEPPREPEGLQPILRSHRLQLGFYNIVDGGFTRTESLWVTVDGAITEVEALIGRPRPAMLIVNDDDHTYAKVRLDAHSLHNAIKNYGAITDSLTRTLVWMSAWDMTRDGELPTRDWVDLVLRAIDSEPEVSVIVAMMRYLRLAIDSYGSPVRRPHYYARMAEAFRQAAHNADPGSEHQLAFIRGLAGYATEPTDLQWLADLLTGEATLEGLVIDADLRWTLIARLTMTAFWEESRIEAEQARDNTAFGAKWAAFCRAALPTAAAKAAAWDLLTGSDEVANSIFQHTAMGFRQAEQLALIADYVPRFFIDLPQIWATHEFYMARDFSLHTFPALFIEEATVEMATHFLESHAGGHVAMLRFVREGRANLIRAMRARQADM